MTTCTTITFSSYYITTNLGQMHSWQIGGDVYDDDDYGNNDDNDDGNDDDDATTMTSTEMTMTTTKMAQKNVVVGHSFKIMEVKG